MGDVVGDLNRRRGMSSQGMDDESRPESIVRADVPLSGDVRLLRRICGRATQGRANLHHGVFAKLFARCRDSIVGGSIINRF